MLIRLILFFFVFVVSFSGWASFPNFVTIERQTPGIGVWQEMPFGKMRILSCSSGVKDLPIVVGGLQVQLNPDWVMKKPTLRPLSDKIPSWIEMPVLPGNEEKAVYKGDVLFPMIYPHNPSNRGEFELGLVGDFPVCQGKNCMTLPIRIGIKLSPNEADYTAACPYLMAEQRHVPLPADVLGIKGYAWPVGDDLKMAFSGVKNAEVAFLKSTDQKVFKVQETQMEKNGVYMWVQVPHWKMGTSQDWLLITDQGIFKVPVLMQNKAFLLPLPPVSKTIWLLGWEIFFLTPLFIWWGVGYKKNNKTWKKEIIWMIILTPIVLVLKGIISFWFPMNYWAYGLVLLGLICLFPPTQKEIALGVLLVWPYFPKIPNLPLGQMFAWGGIMVVEVLIPFVFLYLKANDIGQILQNLKKKNFFGYNLIFLVPTLGLMISFAILGLQERAIFVDELNANGLSVVCEHKEQTAWKKEAQMIRPDSALGKSLKKIYDRDLLVIWQDENGRLILSPNISIRNAKEAISNWKNYHAVNKP